MTETLSFDQITSSSFTEREISASLAQLYALDLGPSFVIVSSSTEATACYFWTGDSDGLADGLDRAALAHRWHGLDYVALSCRHGRVVDLDDRRLFLYPVAPLWDDFDRGRRATKREIADWLKRHGRTAHADPERIARTPWLGFGPLLRNTAEASR
jgi:hypothetical protein